ncbi:glycosyltransferase family 4 protein [Candidatus Colwellia aromaticivorans]|uniref:glycosyltransferase family 4 protein n=1 Tax=Candidatus Colwellia aromaticivorans TaxID=2267621 RepID=UPI000DF3734A|nr:glycosyltransferase family 4 protein [Candidatus Colwellia aromaticivorans]
MKHILLTSYSGALGGMEMKMADEAKLLIVNGYRVSIVISQFSGVESWAHALTENGINVHIRDIPPFIENWSFRHVNKLKALFFHYRFLKKLNVDLVHIYYCWTSYGGSIHWLVSLLNKPMVVSVHNTFNQTEFTPWHIHHFKASFAGVKAIYAVSKSAKNNYDELMGELLTCPVQVIANWVDLTQFNTISDVNVNVKSREELSISEQDTVIASVARLGEQKRPLYLLDVFNAVQKKCSNVTLVMIGQGPLEKEVKNKISKYQLEKKVKLIGFTDRVDKYLKMADMHLLLSLREGFGIVTAEAMACGCVPIVTDIPGSRDVVINSDVGIKVPVDDLESTATTICQLINDSDKLQVMSKNSSVYAQEAFDKVKLSQQLLSFYQRALIE